MLNLFGVAKFRYTFVVFVIDNFLQSKGDKMNNRKDYISSNIPRSNAW